jgi:hypothetical protein
MMDGVVLICGLKVLLTNWTLLLLIYRDVHYNYTVQFQCISLRNLQSFLVRISVLSLSIHRHGFRFGISITRFWSNLLYKMKYRREGEK